MTSPDDGHSGGPDDEAVSRAAGARDGAFFGDAVGDASRGEAIADALAPLSVDEFDAISDRLDRALAPVAAGPDRRRPVGPGSTGPVSTGPVSRSHSSLELPRTSRRARWARRVIPPLVAVAAAMVLWTALPELEPLPAYRLGVTGGEAVHQATVEAWEGDPLPLRPGTRFEVTLTPSSTGPEVELAIFIRGAGGYEAWPHSLKPSPSGAFEIDLVLGKGLTLPPGDAEILFVLAREGDIPRAEDVLGVLEAPSRNVRLYELPVRVLP